MSWRLREWKRSRPGSECAIARTPSHLISNAHAASSRGRSPRRAIIGTTLSGMGSRVASAGGSIRWIIQFFGFSPLSIGNSA